MGRGGHLSSVSDYLANEFVREVANSVCNAEYWLGGSWNVLIAKQWSWSDRTTFSYSHFAQGIAPTVL